MADFDISFDITILKEGRYVDSEFDMGGKTMFGVTEKVARANGYTGEMQDLPIEFAKEIFRTYWDAMKLDLVESQLIANELFDSGILHGVFHPVRWLQENLNALNQMEKAWNDLKEDGNVGMKTLGILNVVVKLPRMVDRILKMMNSDQTQHMKSFSRKKKSQEMNLRGWLDHRVKMPA